MQVSLRSIAHPGQADTLVHFTGRARTLYAPEVYFLTPEGRLDLIASEERLLARPPFGSSCHTVCLSESDTRGVEALLTIGQFAGWGIVVRRDWAWEQGGGPVWYTRDEVWRTVNDRDDQQLLQWMVRTSPQEADWLHEREWRIPSLNEYVDLTANAVVALLVSDPDWEPHRSSTVVPHPTGGQALVETTNRLASAVPRWYWDGQKVTVLPPVPFEEHLLGLLE